MQAYRIRVVIPEDHRLMIEFPAAIPSGPVELIVLVPESETMAPAEQKLEEIARGAEVTKRLNELLSDGELAKEQIRMANEWDEVGTDWNDERW